ncbi:hypothetical protein ACEUZ9_000075 [Paracoccus litorisediminis]|uniref:hypothetical protein n=1 Tax=Paracoccus litorisediminis TaxID=2006130 RepID=UPI00373045F3
MSFTSEGAAAFVSGQPVSKAEMRALWAAVDGVVDNGGKLFNSRSEAISFGQDKLPALLDRIIVVNGSYLEIRGQGQPSDDPLFTTAPQWGVLTRIPVRALVEAISNIGDTLVFSTTGTQSAQLAQFTKNANQAHMTVFNGQEVQFYWTTTNTAADPVARYIPDPVGAPGTYTDLVIKNKSGLQIGIGDLIGGNRYKGFLFGGNAIRLQGAFGIDDINGLRVITNSVLSIGAAIEANEQMDDVPFVGDEPIVATGRNGQVASYWDQQGRLVGRFVSGVSPHLGDTQHAFLQDLLGRALAYFKASGEMMLPYLIVPGEYLGDPTIILGDCKGRPLLWWDGQKVAGAIAGGDGGGGGGATISRPVPNFTGNAYQVIDDSTSIRFLSDGYMGKLMGFEERDSAVIAETGPYAYGIVALGGGGFGAVGAVPENWRYHVLDKTLSHEGGYLAAEAHGIARQMIARSMYATTPTVIQVTRAVGSPVEADTEVGSTAYAGLLTDLATAKAELENWDKQLVVYCILLSLLGGAPTTSEIAADTEYAAIAIALRGDVVDTTLQGQAVNWVIVSQSFGTRSDGQSTVALAEGKLDYLHPAQGFIVATPRHPFPLEPATAATPTANGAAMIQELCALAAAERDAGRDWFCPRVQSAVRSGSTVTVTFVAMTDLVLGTAHGFTLRNAGPVTITGVTMSGKVATVTLSGTPPAGAELCLAWGRIGDPGDGYAANRSTIRDQWSANSLMVPGQTLYRYALSGRFVIA